MGIFDILTTAANIAKESGKLELQGEILGVYEKLLGQQKKISDLESENRGLKEKIKTKESLIVKNDAYWTKEGDGPFCLTCHDSKDLLIHMVSWGAGQHKCNNCNHVVDTDPIALEQLRRRQEQEIENNRRNNDWGI